MNKADLLKRKIQHIDIKQPNYKGIASLMGDMGNMSFQARNMARGAEIYCEMLKDKSCVVYLTLAGSLISAGLKQVIVDMINNNMIDVIVSTGANIVDQDFFEALGFKHYRGSVDVDDNQLRELMIDRIYDTFIDEEELRICDDTISKIAKSLPARPYSSREFIIEMGRYLEEREELTQYRENSIVFQCYKRGVPIFVPAFSDCSAGFGLVHHQYNNPEYHLSIDSAKDFLELTQIKIHNANSGIFIIGGGVPKNFVQDIVVAGEMMNAEVPMHKYAVQITVADERDGALSGSTLREANSWGKVDMEHEQMIFAEATIAMPLVVAYAYHSGIFKDRTENRFNDLLKRIETPV